MRRKSARSMDFSNLSLWSLSVKKGNTSIFETLRTARCQQEITFSLCPSMEMKVKKKLLSEGRQVVSFCILNLSRVVTMPLSMFYSSSSSSSLTYNNVSIHSLATVLAAVKAFGNCSLRHLHDAILHCQRRSPPDTPTSQTGRVGSCAEFNFADNCLS